MLSGPQWTQGIRGQVGIRGDKWTCGLLSLSGSKVPANSLYSVGFLSAAITLTSSGVDN